MSARLFLPAFGRSLRRALPSFAPMQATDTVRSSAMRRLARSAAVDPRRSRLGARFPCPGLETTRSKPGRVRSGVRTRSGARMAIKTPRQAVTGFLLCAFLGAGTTSAALAFDGLLLVGDSWAEQQWQDQSHALVFGALGFGAVQVYGSATTESGTTAADWTQPGRRQVLTDELALRDDVDVVQITLGGNDFLDAWRTTL